MTIIDKNDRIAYKLYMTIEGFIKYKNASYKKYYTFLRKEKLMKIQNVKSI